MKATELRLGNYIDINSALPDSKYHYMVVSITAYTADLVILGTDLQRVNCTSYQLTDCNPIPLSEEWLIKFEYELPNGRFDISRSDYESFAVHFEGKLLTAVKYVHQLQNLYFALKVER